MRARTRARARMVAIIIAVSAAFGTASSLLSGADALSGLLSGILIAVTLSTLEISLQERWAVTVRQWPVALLLVLRTVAYGAAFIVAVHVATALSTWSLQPILQPTRLVSSFTLLLSFAFALAVNFVVMLRRLLGPGVLASLLTGRYRRPRKEERIVLFMDLRGSTEITERIGDLAFHRFLNQVFTDITDPVLEAGGEIYRYIGDEIIVTWLVDRGAPHPHCVECVFAIEDVLAARRQRYQAEFGVEPRLRAALHAGPLIVGEMGDVKREIVLLGDTMNTAARIETACRVLARDVIVSAPALSLLSLPPQVKAESLGVVALRGKESKLELFALER